MRPMLDKGERRLLAPTYGCPLECRLYVELRPADPMQIVLIAESTDWSAAERWQVLQLLPDVVQHQLDAAVRSAVAQEDIVWGRHGSSLRQPELSHHTV